MPGHTEHTVNDYLQNEAIETMQWPAMSPDMNPIEHVWDVIGRKINERDPPCQNIAELSDAFIQEWRQFPQQRLKWLVYSMRRRVQELHRKRGG